MAGGASSNRPRLCPGGEVVSMPSAADMHQRGVAAAHLVPVHACIHALNAKHEQHDADHDLESR